MIDQNPSLSEPPVSPPVFQTFQTPVISTDLTGSSPKQVQSVGDRLSNFTDYIAEYPSRVPLGAIKSFGLLGIMMFGSVAGLLLLKQNSDNRNQASEGNKFATVCKIRDVKKLAIEELPNSTACLLNGKTYYSCNTGYTFANDKCVINAPTR